MRGIFVVVAMTGLSACHLVFGHDPTTTSVSREGGKDFRPSAEVRTLDALADAQPNYDRATRDSGREGLKSDTAHDTRPPDGQPADTFVKPDSVKPCQHPPVAKNCTSEWCQIPSGCFTMGSPNNELCRDAGEALVKVWLSHGLEFGRKEVTQDQFKNEIGGGTYNPSTNTKCLDSGLKEVTQDCPVETVTWHEAAAYCNALSAKYGYKPCYSCTGNEHGTFCYPTAKPIYGCAGYRLPTSAEWEYAYRGGTTTSSFAGTIQSCGPGSDPVADQLGWYAPLSGAKTHVGATFNGNPNAVPPITAKIHPWWLHDMAGNVAEWVHDVWPGGGGGDDPEGPPHPTVKPTMPSSTPLMMIRGGSYKSQAGDLRSARKYNDSAVAPPRMFADVGFRCVRSLP